MDFHAAVHPSRMILVLPATARYRGCHGAVKSLSMNTLKTQAKVFCVRLSEIDENGAFSANDHGISPDPDFTSLPNLHQKMARSCANHVFQSWQVFAMRAQNAVDRESWIMSVFDLDEA